MKKILLSLASLAILVSCGPSAQELAEKAKQDSIRVADSILTVETAAAQAAALEQAKLDSIAKAEAEKLVQDSIANATKKK